MKNIFHYVALGDSITAGYSAPNKQGYVAMLGKMMEPYFPTVKVSNFSQGGYTSRSLLSSIRYNPKVRRSIRSADLITIYIGGNDLKHAYLKYLLHQNNEIYIDTLETYGFHLKQIYHAIYRINPTSLFALTLYNPFPNSTTASIWIPALNGTLAHISTRWRVPVIDIYSPFQHRESTLIHNYRTGTLKDFRLLGGNPIHPSLQGHQVIAHTLWNALGWT